MSFSTDRSIQQDWIARKGNDNPFSFLFQSGGSPFNIATYTYALYVFRFGADYNTLADAVVTKTQASGLTNGGASGTVIGSITKTDLQALQPDQYFWKLQVTHPDTTIHDWYNGQFTLQNELYVGDTISSVTGEINVADLVIDAELTIANVALWGNIGGTLTNQTDLVAALALKHDLANTAVALVDASTMDLTAIKHTLSSSSATRTFTISYTGDDITLIVTLSATSATYTFPATSLCVSEGVASGDNLLALSGTSGDKYAIAIKKVGSNYYVVSKNFGQ